MEGEGKKNRTEGWGDTRKGSLPWNLENPPQVLEKKKRPTKKTCRS